jgi:hypothetical protein
LKRSKSRYFTSWGNCLSPNLPTDSADEANILQECLGPAAVQHELFLRQIDLVPEENRTEQDKERIAAVQEIARGLLLPKSVLTEIQCEQGSSGQLLPVNLVFGKQIEMQLFPLDWPAWFRNRPDMKDFMDRITRARADCVEAVGKNNFEPCQRLMKAIDDLDKRFAELHRRHFQMLIAGVPREIESKVTTENREIQRAKTFMKTLRCATARFIEMDSYPQAEEYLLQEAQSHGASDQISLITVLAAMEERGLRFRKVSRPGETTHQVMFEKMCSYYAAVYSLAINVQEQEENIAAIDNQIAESHDRERWGMVFDATALWLTRPPK